MEVSKITIRLQVRFTTRRDYRRGMMLSRNGKPPLGSTADRPE
jgi:hypothetical protein